MLAIINAGHSPNGYPDPGAVNYSLGIRECDIALAISNKVKYYLTQAGVTAKVIQDDDLDNICNFSNDNKADIFVSIHCNSAENKSANGFEVYTSRGQTKADNLATFIYKQIENTFPDMYGRSDTSDGDVDKEAGFYVLVNTNAPACLIETAFISNDAEAQLLSTSSFQDKYARAIARGITDFEGDEQ